MYDDPYDDGGGAVEDAGFHSRSSRFHHPREDFVSASRGFQKQAGRVFISRTADIGIVLVLLLVSGVGVMWFISQVPSYVETASAHYYWAMDLYNTWGTPSMRWLFINLVVGVIVATSGLLSAFGGGGGAVDSRNFKGRVYEGAHAPSYREPTASSAYLDSYHATSARFSGSGYDFPAYNPYVQPVKLGPSEEEENEDGPHDGAHDGVRDHAIPKNAPPKTAKASSPDADPPPMEVASREIPPAAEEEEISAAKELPAATAATADVPAVEAEDEAEPKRLTAPEPEVTEEGGDDAVAIISKVYDHPDEGGPGPHHQRVKTDSAVEVGGVSEPEVARPDGLPKSRTFTIGRVIRRDQLADFIEPLSRKLERVGRKVRPDPLKDPHADPGTTHSRDVVDAKSPAAGSDGPAAAAAQSRDPAAAESESESATHRRRHSAESVPPVTHRRRISSESLPSATKPGLSIQPSAAGVANAKQPPTPSLSKRSIVYPPALLTPPADTSPPPSPPIETAIPPPPPPHLKLPAALHASCGKASGEDTAAVAPEKSSAKPPPVQIPSKEEKKARHSRTPSSSHIGPSSGHGKDGAEAAVQERSLTVAPHKPSSGGQEIQAAGEFAGKDKEESPANGDDLQQQIDDFLARFHENWRLQRQESLARYKKKLEVPDD